jgi:hypothetical protein
VSKETGAAPRTLSVSSSFTPLNAAIICSPAFVLFPIHDPYGGFRKEILFFALLSFVCNRLSGLSLKVRKKLPALIGLVSLFLVLSHEMLLVCFPYLICAFVISDKAARIETKKTALFLIPSAIMWILIIYLGPADRQNVLGICNSLGIAVPEEGAIPSLAWNVMFAHLFVMKSNPGITLEIYAILGILSFAPLVLRILSDQFREYLINREVRLWLIICVGVSFIATIPLMWVVADYGRLIYIHVTCLSLLILMATPDKTNQNLNLTLTGVGFWVLAFGFASSWRLIHWQANFQNVFIFYPLINRLANLLHS